jgi:uncharacterized protein (TIGR01777 family)
LKKGPISLRWHAALEDVVAGERFVDVQEQGPFAAWRHEHLFETEAGRGQLRDRVRYTLPYGLNRLGCARRLFNKDLERLFRYRHERMRRDLEDRTRFPSGDGRCVLITGQRGLIGRRLTPYLKNLGYVVRGLTRGPTQGDLFHWDPAKEFIDAGALEGVFAVIHLAGEGIAEGRWNAARKDAILQSRVKGTRCLVEAIRRLEDRPQVFISASGVSYYAEGIESGEADGMPGSGFLADVCRQWEAEAARASKLGLRTVLVRTGIVLDPLGGALGKMLTPFRMGLGGPVGSGRQGFPWISIDDHIRILAYSLREDSLEGPVNAVAPQIMKQGAFARDLGWVLRRPAVLPLPTAMVKLLFGEMGKEALLSDLRVRPDVLQERGFPFHWESAETALRFLLGQFTCESGRER